MGTRNTLHFIDPSALPFIVNIPFTGLTSAADITVDSGVINPDRDFYGFVIRSSGNGKFSFKLTDGDGQDLSSAFIDGIDVMGEEIVRNLGESGRLVPIFAPKGSKITVVLHKDDAGTVDGTIEVRGVTIEG